MEYNLSKIQPCNPWNPVQLAAGALHHDSVLVKIHVAAHVGNISHNTLFIYNDFHIEGAVEHHLVILHKGNLAVRAEPVRKIRIGRVLSPSAGKQEFLHLRSIIPSASRDRDILYMHRQKQDCRKQYDCYGNSRSHVMFSQKIPHAVPHLVMISFIQPPDIRWLDK